MAHIASDPTYFAFYGEKSLRDQIDKLAQKKGHSRSQELRLAVARHIRTTEVALQGNSDAVHVLLGVGSDDL